MRAITLHQPYATLIALGHKKIETRSWEAPDWIIGERIAIHAGKSKEDLWVCQTPAFTELGIDAESLPFGAVVATAVVWRCAVMREVSIEQLEARDPREFAFGLYEPGSYVWLLEDVEALDEPIEARGYQKVWTWDQ